LGEFGRDGKHWIVKYHVPGSEVKDSCTNNIELMTTKSKELSTIIKNLKLLESFSLAYRSRSCHLNEMCDDLVKYLSFVNMDLYDEVKLLANPTVFDVDPKLIYDSLTQKIKETFNKKIVKKMKSEKFLYILVEIGDKHAYFSVDHTVQEKELKFKHLEIGSTVVLLRVCEIYLKQGNRNNMMNTLLEIITSFFESKKKKVNS